jgi:hypothetical protein
MVKKVKPIVLVGTLHWDCADGDSGTGSTRLVVVDDQIKIRSKFDGQFWKGVLKKTDDGYYIGTTREEVLFDAVMLKDGIIDKQIRPGVSEPATVRCRLIDNNLTGTWVEDGWEVTFSAALMPESEEECQRAI